MRGLQLLGGALTMGASVWLLRVVLHGYTDHSHLDGFHLAVAVIAAAAGVFFLLRVLRAGADRGENAQR